MGVTLFFLLSDLVEAGVGFSPSDGLLIPAEVEVGVDVVEVVMEEVEVGAEEVVAVALVGCCGGASETCKSLISFPPKIRNR